MSNLLTKQRLAEMAAEEITAEEIEDAIVFEHEEWQKNNIDPQMVTFHSFMFDTLISTVRDILIRAELTTADEFSLMVNRTTLANLRFHRSNIMEQITKARIMSGVTPDAINQFGKPGNGII
jgi:hypothetical protein